LHFCENARCGSTRDEISCSQRDVWRLGKIKWLKRHGFVLPSGTNYVLTNYKWMLAGRDRVLVDDYQKNCAMFDKHDGVSVVFPQRWNGAGIGEDRVRYVEDFLKLL
jgi:hypothetical protein